MVVWRRRVAHSPPVKVDAWRRDRVPPTPQQQHTRWPMAFVVVVVAAAAAEALVGWVCCGLDERERGRGVVGPRGDDLWRPLTPYDAL